MTMFFSFFHLIFICIFHFLMQGGHSATSAFSVGDTNTSTFLISLPVDNSTFVGNASFTRITAMALHMDSSRAHALDFVVTELKLEATCGNGALDSGFEVR